MLRKTKESNMNLYYLNDGQVKEADKKKLAKEREKRLKQAKEKENAKDKFDLETETVIQMTNRNNIKKEQEKKKKLTKKEQKRRKKIKKIMFVLKIFVIIGIIAGGIAFALTSPIFNIKDIKVSNNGQTVPQETIISLSGLKYDQNIFRFNSGNIIENIKQNPYIENVTINRKLPSTIEIKVEERVHKYSVDFLGKYAYINNQGYILEISEDSKGFPIIQGITTAEEQVVEGARLNVEDLEKLENVIKIMDISAENGLDSMVTSIDITNENEYSIYLQQEKKIINLGDCSNLSNKMLYVVAILEQTKEQEGEIFVNRNLNSGFQAYFKPKI